MKPTLTNRLLKERHVFGLGVFLLALAILLPFSVMAIHAAIWNPPPPDTTKNAGDLRPSMVVLEGGVFLMGSPGDEPDRDDDEEQHEVEISPFMISLTEVTQGQYKEVMAKNPVETEREIFGGPCSEAGVGGDLPVVCVTWFEAVRYCNLLSEREGLPPVYEGLETDRPTRIPGSTGYRLLTEAEWEFAARAGTSTRWVGTSDEKLVCDYGNVGEGFACDDGYATLAPADAKRANRWLLHGFGGNAAEWVWDTYSKTFPAGGKDPVADDTGAFLPSVRVLRGGSWWGDPRSSRVAIRGWFDPSGRSLVVGFRVARSLPSAL